MGNVSMSTWIGKSSFPPSSPGEFSLSNSLLIASNCIRNSSNFVSRGYCGIYSIIMTPKVRKPRAKRCIDTKFVGRKITSYFQVRRDAEICQESSGNSATLVRNNSVSQAILEYTHSSFAAVGNETAFQEHDVNSPTISLRERRLKSASGLHGK